jgi:hypothetical protein
MAPGSLFAICALCIIFCHNNPLTFAITSNAYLQITWNTIMRTQTFFKVAVLTGLLALAGCSSKVAAPEQYSGFLKDYSGLQQTTSATGKPTLRWVDPSYNEANYDSIVWNPITYYPVPKPTTQIGQKTLDELLSYTNNKMKTAIGQRKPIVATQGIA